MSDVLKKSSTANKRKSDGSSAASKKKARTSKDPHASARAVVASINAAPESFDLPDGDDDVRQTLVSLAAYAKTLEPVEKSSSQIATEVDRLRRTAVSGIMKQMTVSLDASPCSGYALYCTLPHFDALY
jgi:cytoskeletal protein RodZ